VQRLVHDVFINGYVSAMRPTLAVAVAALVLGALSCGLIVRRNPSAVAVLALEETALTAIPDPAA